MIAWKRPAPEWPWETRRDGELTPVYLGRVLDWVGGLGDMPRRAREGHFDDFAAPAEVATGFELIALVRELDRRKRRLGPVARGRIRLVIEAVKAGEFDATSDESARWAASADGQATIRALVEGR
jgi:hypothetical protein